MFLDLDESLPIGVCGGLSDADLGAAAIPIGLGYCGAGSLRSPTDELMDSTAYGMAAAP